MKKKILTIFSVGIIGLSHAVLAENEARYSSETGIVHIPKVIVDGFEYQVDMQQTDGMNFTVTNISVLEHESTANGTYDYNTNSQHLIFYWENSTFEKCGPQVRGESAPLDERDITLSNNTQIWHKINMEDGGDIVWSRQNGTSNSIVGVWTSEAVQITFNADETVFVQGTCP